VGVYGLEMLFIIETMTEATSDKITYRSCHVLSMQVSMPGREEAFGKVK
jgi:hypothetical protein